jgi:formate dehydrogenase subunit delta|tara:strand:+ start:92719 stop:92922 length:204 start_codon:yes stop_codon:yes gene_type:complete
MSDTTETLVRMANQIADNLMQESDPAAATAQHIKLYWDPRMKAKILAAQADGLNDFALKAVKILNMQ